MFYFVAHCRVLNLITLILNVEKFAHGFQFGRRDSPELFWEANRNAFEQQKNQTRKNVKIIASRMNPQSLDQDWWMRMNVSDRLNDSEKRSRKQWGREQISKNLFFLFSWEPHMECLLHMDCNRRAGENGGCDGSPQRGTESHHRKDRGKDQGREWPVGGIRRVYENLQISFQDWIKPVI